MFKPRIQFLLLGLLPILFFAQSDDNFKKGHVYFSLGTEYRITPIYPIDDFSISENDFSGFVDPDLQNSGMGINLGMEYFFSEKFSISLINTFRYDFIVSRRSNIEPSFGVEENKYGLLLDHHLYLSYYFKVFKKGNFYLSAGFSRLNTNSDFSTKESFFDENGNLIASVFGIENFSYWANRFELGHTIGKGKLSLGIYMSQNTNYFDETTSFIIPFVDFKINLGKL